MISKAEQNGGSASREPFGWIVKVSAALSFCLLVIFLVTVIGGGGDYVGPDNDDAMRLIIVRDYLAGQGWFDHMQYRLGLEPGTLMHWSRLVDLPIAALIRVTSLLATDKETAEAIALFIWPVSLTFPLAFFAILGGYWLGGKQTAMIAGIFVAIHAYTSYRFAPGAIDHHNIQLVLIAAFVAAILDPQKRSASGILAGLAAASALAIGAETTPLVATGAITISLRWALAGPPDFAFTRAFALSFALFTALLYGATVPPSQYFLTACDTLSAGYLHLTAFGGISLFAATILLSNRPTLWRMGSLAAIGIAAAALTVTVMPECLSNPYSSLDPLLKDIWLSTIIEAQSFSMQLERDASLIGGHYAVGLLALLVCAMRVWRNAKREAHLILLTLIGTAWLVTLVQLRGSIFANLISIFPLALAISDLRNASRMRDAAAKTQLAFIVLALASLPASWFLAGAVIFRGEDKLTQIASPASSADQCRTDENLMALNVLAPGTIAAVSNAGAPILRLTNHRVLSAPYHRNQAGMLAVLNAALSPPGEALKILEKAGAHYLVLCEAGAKELELAKRAPEGLFARLIAGQQVNGLQRVEDGWAQTMHVYSVH